VINVSTLQKIKEQLKSIDVYELMLVEIEDYANWLVNDIMNECREYAEEKARGDKGYFNIYFNTCLHKGRQYLKEDLVKHAGEVYESAKTLFGAFIEFKPEKDDELLVKVDEIIQNALKKLYPYEILIVK
jgi:hypothetical protein